MSSLSYAKEKAKEFYANHSIEQRVNKVIYAANKKDNRYYLFRNVLSSETVSKCLENLPRSGNLSSIQLGGRQFDAKAESKNSKILQHSIRNADVYFQQRSQSATERQKMKLPAFYLMIASKLGLTNASLGLTDRLIVHDNSLKVCYFFLQ
jgi:hypothetical protein